MIRPFVALALSLALAASTFAQGADDKEAAAAAAAAAKTKVEELKVALKGKDEDPKIAAITACGEAPHSTTAAALAPLLGDPSDNVRTAAAKALGHMKGLADAAKALHAGLGANEDKTKVLGAIFDAIGEVNNPASVAVVKDWVNHRMAKRDGSDAPGLTEAIDCMGALKWKSCVSALIDLGKKNIVANGARGGHGMRAKEDNKFQRALQRLTGEKLEDMDAWDDWWKKNAGSFKDDLTAK
ncbi:MAG: HEAT repeat domain-containing protein [Planctomycetes bacterium]|nr:HEAT repeat domain-containing protein [Planctomycetota bacterium]